MDMVQLGHRSELREASRVIGNEASPAGSKGATMPMRRLKRSALTQLSLGGCAVMFNACGLIQQARAQYIPPPVPPPPPPVFNPSPPNTTVPQPSYKSVSPATPSGVSGPEITSPVNEEPPSTTTRFEREASAKTRSVHHHHRGRFVGPRSGSHYCGYSPCVRIYPSAFYGAPASGLWWPGYYDYAPGQFAHGRPRYSGYWRAAGYHGD